MKKLNQHYALIFLFVLIKVAFNLCAAPHFGYHRDELLHLALANHLDWGYKEVPPFIAVLAKLSLTFFGDTVFTARIFSTIAAGTIIWLTGLITIEFGGKKFAISLACLTVIFSPAFVASGYLFQPVVFDQLWWVFSVYFIIKYSNTTNFKFLYWLAVVVGFGMLTKYTMAFFVFALITAILISQQRKLLFNKHIIGAALLALILFLPNIIWQFQHHFPVITHMKALQKEQLDYISPGNFIKQQLVVNGVALLVWLTGFLFLLFSKQLQKFRFIAFAYLLIFIFLLKMNGKNYYLFGAYPMLFAAGGFAFEQIIKARYVALRTFVVAVFTLPNLVLLPLLLPILPLKQTLAVIKFDSQNIPAISFAITWEDQKQHPLTQDYADMLGWEEMVAETAKIYHTLSAKEKIQTVIIADNYGEAGAFQRFGPKYNLPATVCLNSSFALWAPENLSAKTIIYVSDDADVSDLKEVVGNSKLMYKIANPLAREFGTGIFLLRDVKFGFNKIYRHDLLQTRK
ncbi:MAG: glycosyltransferase family 39 protein [Sphingobacteriaceae bacterium]|nr:MAG: glycosyltransferase family 39 protein [Sphingobacteriaceae bacterium]